MLHVLTGAACNNNCLFCMEQDRQARAAHVGAQSPADIRAMLAAHEDRDEVLFTSGEPTLNPSLLDHVASAREEGYRIISLITNGRLLAYPGVARRLVERGVNRVTVSIHGHTARLHDSLTRTPGSYVQSRAALTNLLRLRRGRQLEVRTATVITRRNLEHLGDILGALARGAPDHHVLNMVMPVGRADRHFEILVPGYSEVARTLACLAHGEPSWLGRTRLVDMPVCVGRVLPPHLWGEPEIYTQFEAVGSSGLQGVCDGQGAGRAEPAISGQERAYYQTGRTRKDAHQRVRDGKCQGCAARPVCAGVYRRYLDARGDEELTPLSAQELENLAPHLRSGDRAKKGRIRLADAGGAKGADNKSNRGPKTGA